MSNANANFQRALVAFSKNGNSAVFKQAVEKYLKQFNKTVNQKVQNILIGTTFGSIKNRKTLLNRLAAQTAVVAQRAAAAGAPNPSTENTNRRIRAILASYKEQYNRERGMTFHLEKNIQFSAGKNFNKNRLGQILNSNYTNKNFVRNVKSVLGLLVAPPLPEKPPRSQQLNKILTNFQQRHTTSGMNNTLKRNLTSGTINKIQNKQFILELLKQQKYNNSFKSNIRKTLGYFPNIVINPAAPNPFGPIPKLSPPPSPSQTSNNVEEIKQILSILNRSRNPNRSLPSQNKWKEMALRAPGINKKFSNQNLNQALQNYNFDDLNKMAIKAYFVRR
jgi:hypothetical protein